MYKRQIGIPKHQLNIRLSGVPDDSELIETNHAMPITDRARNGCVDHRTSGALIDHDEVIAQPMHLHEGQAIRERSGLHGAAYTPVVNLLLAMGKKGDDSGLTTAGVPDSYPASEGR